MIYQTSNILKPWTSTCKSCSHAAAQRFASMCCGRDVYSGGGP